MIKICIELSSKDKNDKSLRSQIGNIMAYSTYSSPERSNLQIIKWKMTYLKVQPTKARKMKKKKININVWAHRVPKNMPAQNQIYLDSIIQSNI